MCRHTAYVGPPVAIRDVVVSPPLGLYRQSWAPARQQYGTVNVDGFGVGWYADGDPIPARYRAPGPIWSDPSFADLSRVTRTKALLAAVRSATEGCATGVEAAAPFAADRWLFSHNGVIPGWPGSVASLAATLPAAELLDLEARSDSALVWALVLHRLRDGVHLGKALADVVAEISEVCPEARLNLLATDGTVIAATVYGDDLGYRADHSSVLVASEPPDDDPSWVDVPDRSLLVASPGSVDVSPLATPGKADSR